METSQQARAVAITLQPCIYRAERPSQSADGGSGGVALTCKAMGGKSLGRKGQDDVRIAEICNPCTIPQEAAFRPCLFLVPIKVERKRVLKDYFTCRWLYRLRPDRPDEKTRYMCAGCPFWFPMPPVSLVRDLEQAAKKMIDYHAQIWENPPPPPPKLIWIQRPPAPRTLWQRTRDSLIRWWGW
jgi:hypothetical protein